MPNALQMFRHRSPQRPEMSRMAVSPGATQLVTAASIPPVPDAVSTSGGVFVWKTYLRALTTSPRIALKSGLRGKKNRFGQFQEGSSRKGGGPGGGQTKFLE